MDEKVVYEVDRMYNPDQKEEYLNTFDNEGSQRTISYIFYHSQPIEEQLGYDLCNFSFDEIVNVLENMNSMNKNVARTNARFMKSYISWCIENGRRNNNIHPLADMGVNWADKYVFSKKLYLNENDIHEMDKELVAQDSVILYLLFSGVFGNGLSELTNLKYGDINWNDNKLLLRETHNDGSETTREHIVSDKCMRVITSAYNELSYHSIGSARESELVRNDYILRNAKTSRTNDFAAMSKHGIYRRLSNISDYYGLPYLTANNIRKSGMIKMAADFIAEGEEIEKDQLYAIADKFGVNKVQNGEYVYYNVTLLKQFINEDNIEELYPEVYNN